MNGEVLFALSFLMLKSAKLLHERVMNRTTKLLSVAIAVLIVLAGTEAYVLQTTPKSTNQLSPFEWLVLAIA